MYLGDIIKEYRNKNNLSMYDFALISGLSKGYISMLEKNENPKTKEAIIPSLKTFKLAAEAMKMDFDVLIKAIDGDQKISLDEDACMPKSNIEMGSRIKQRRDELGLTLKDVGDKIGVVSSTILRYENGTITKPKIPVINAIAIALDVDPAWICCKTDKKQSLEDENRTIKEQDNIHIVPSIKLKNILKDKYLTPLQLPSEGEYFGLIVTDNTMEPQIFDGDIVIVKRQDDIKNDNLAVVQVNGNLVSVKKAIKQKNGILLTSLNAEAFSPAFYCLDEINSLPVKILGKVVEIRRTIE